MRVGRRTTRGCVVLCENRTQKTLGEPTWTWWKLMNANNAASELLARRDPWQGLKAFFFFFFFLLNARSEPFQQLVHLQPRTWNLALTSELEMPTKVVWMLTSFFGNSRVQCVCVCVVKKFILSRPFHPNMQRQSANTYSRRETGEAPSTTNYSGSFGAERRRITAYRKKQPKDAGDVF